MVVEIVRPLLTTNTLMKVVNMLHCHHCYYGRRLPHYKLHNIFYIYCFYLMITFRCQQPFLNQNMKPNEISKLFVGRTENYLYKTAIALKRTYSNRIIIYLHFLFFYCYYCSKSCNNTAIRINWSALVTKTCNFLFIPFDHLLHLLQIDSIYSHQERICA